MNLKGMLLSLAPWLIFAIGAKALGPAWVGVVALVALLVVIGSLIARRRKGVSVIDVTGLVTFGILTTVVLLGGPAVKVWVVDYGRGGCAIVLALVMAVSAITVPFTEQYARDVVPEKYWHSPLFRAVNRKISGLWAAIAFIHAGCHLLAGHLAATSPDQHGTAGLSIVLNWIIPIGLTIVGIVATQKLAATEAHSPAKATVSTGLPRT